MTHTARTYNMTVNHRRRILSTTHGHPARWNDKTLANFDSFMTGIRNGGILDDVVFELFDVDDNRIALQTPLQSLQLLVMFPTMMTIHHFLRVLGLNNSNLSISKAGPLFAYLPNDTEEIIYRSQVRSTHDPDGTELCPDDVLDGESCSVTEFFRHASY